MTTCEEDAAAAAARLSEGYCPRGVPPNLVRLKPDGTCPVCQAWVQALTLEVGLRVRWRATVGSPVEARVIAPYGTGGVLEMARSHTVKSLAVEATNNYMGGSVQNVLAVALADTARAVAEASHAS